MTQKVADDKAIRSLSAGSPRILVFGDAMLDRYTFGDVSRVSPEAPVPILNSDQHEVRLGGAANVAQAAVCLGARVTLASVTGGDGDGVHLRECATRSRIDCRHLLTDSSRPTTVKHRFVGRANGRHQYQMLRVDREVRAPLPDSLDKQLANIDICRNFDAVLISDYGKGVCNSSTVPRIIESASDCGLPIIIDPARGADYEMYRNASMITPNRSEAEIATSLPLASPKDAGIAGMALCRSLSISWTATTLDREGIVLASPHEYQHYPALARDVYDVTGAGDIVLAVVGFCLGAGGTIGEAVRLANMAAGLSVEHIGTASISWEQILDAMEGHCSCRVVSLKDLCLILSEFRCRGERVVFTNGCFDLLHAGHITYLQEARRLGDVLVVGLNSDASVRQLKGATRPIICARERAMMLASLSCVDYVVIFEESTPHSLLEAIRPDVLAKGGTYCKDNVVGREVVEAYGGKVCVLSRVDGASTSQIIERIGAESRWV